MWLNRGYELEDRISTELQRLDGATVQTEKELTRTYGWLASSVDFLVETPDQLVFVQVKYLSTRRKESVNINKFLSSIRHIMSQHPSKNKPFVGLWVSRLHPFNDNETLLNSQNIHVVSCFDSMDTLVAKTVKYFT